MLDIVLTGGIFDIHYIWELAVFTSMLQVFYIVFTYLLLFFLFVILMGMDTVEPGSVH
jgi:hypothetical protein